MAKRKPTHYNAMMGYAIGRYGRTPKSKYTGPIPKSPEYNPPKQKKDPSIEKREHYKKAKKDYKAAIILAIITSILCLFLPILFFMPIIMILTAYMCRQKIKRYELK